MEQFTKRNAFLFQGVGPEYQKLLYLLDNEQKKMLDYYCSVVYQEIELDLWNYLFNYSKTKYSNMFNDWIAIYTCDYIIYHTLVDHGIKPQVFLGYSMGLITAMACAKSISFESGLHILLNICKYPQYAIREKESMAVIIGITCNDVSKIINENSLKDYVEVASENNEYCIVISGIKDSVEKVTSIAELQGALKVKEINAAYAFHSKFLTIGIEKFEEFIKEVEVLDSMIPIISSLNQNIIQDSNDLKRELVKNMASRMYWKSSVEKAISIGIDSFVEVSLENSLTKFSRLINMDYEFFSYSKWSRKVSSNCYAEI